jgi:hypothetical protein
MNRRYAHPLIALLLAAAGMLATAGVDAATPATAGATVAAPHAASAAQPAPKTRHRKKHATAAAPVAAPAAATHAPATPPAAPAPQAATAAPGAPANPAAGTVTLVTGHASAATSSGEIRDLIKGGAVYSGEVITTSTASFVNVEFSDGGRVLLRPETRFAIERYQYAANTQGTAATPGTPQAQAPQESAFFRLLKGGFRAVSGLIGHTRREDYAVQTPVATIGIRGTDYEVRYCNGDCADITPAPKDGLYAGVQSGGIQIDSPAGSIATAAGGYAFVAAGANPVSLPTRPPALGQNLPDPKTCN